jgi:hypothetical protein
MRRENGSYTADCHQIQHSCAQGHTTVVRQLCGACSLLRQCLQERADSNPLQDQLALKYPGCKTSLDRLGVATVSQRSRYLTIITHSLSGVLLVMESTAGVGENKPSHAPYSIVYGMYGQAGGLGSRRSNLKAACTNLLEHEKTPEVNSDPEPISRPEKEQHTTAVTCYKCTITQPTRSATMQRHSTVYLHSTSYKS